MISVRLADGTVCETEAGTVDEILTRLGENPYEILAASKGELLLADDFVEDGAELLLTSIVHGG
ncbi:MAG TPA: hypothetical protein O0X39_00770 [Methanocorpusculum sp.]|nr:hypothetical protein [Methanocorpusculum sp.]